MEDNIPAGTDNNDGSVVNSGLSDDVNSSPIEESTTENLEPASESEVADTATDSSAQTYTSNDSANAKNVGPAEVSSDKEKQTKEQMKKKPREPNGILIECLEDIFEDETKVKSFVAGNFQKVYKTHSNKNFTAIISSLVIYCSSNGQIGYLWERIKEIKDIREEKYHSWHSKWRTSYEKYQSWLQQSEQNQETSSARDQAEVANFGTTRVQGITPKDRNQSHPLTKDDDCVQAWFFTDLSLQEQSYTITTALFQGINRIQIDQLAQEVQEQLFGKHEGESDG